ncbi:MAG: alkaline phosphatase [Cyanobacteria bacterium J06642_2]
MSGNVIFIHPDGTSPSHYAAARFASVGTDGRLNWDDMDSAGVYLGHMDDSIVATSNGGAVVHAYGIKSVAPSYGFDENGEQYESLAGTQNTLMEDAIAAGRPTAVINSGFIAEPGTGVFLASVESRRDTEAITAQIVESGVNVILGGGETDYLPEGVVGVLGEEGTRTDGRNLVEEAEAMGYTVVYSQEELDAVSADTDKLLGIFAASDTYNDIPEGTLRENGFVDENGELILYGQPGNENPPTVADMLQTTLDLDLFANEEEGFFVVLEEEASDNFGNNNNAVGTIEATLRADAAIGVAENFIDDVNPNTLVLTAADSDAGGLEVDDRSGETVGSTGYQAFLDEDGERSVFEVPYDGQTGNDTAPFVTGAPDVDGDTFEFGVSWAGLPDFAGSIVSKASGLNADKLPATVDNTGMYRLMYETLFDEELTPPEGIPDDPTPAPEPTSQTGGVIFIHPDGTSPSHYAAARFASQGTDGRLNWDKMTDAGVYLGHLDDRIVSTSNGGAVVHAYGIKSVAPSYGFDENGEQYTSAAGTQNTIMEDAIAAGKPTAVINSGFIAEPGTGVFLASSESRRDTEEITAQIVESGVNVILGAGETDYLPEGTVGFFGEEGTRTDGRNLIEEAEDMGYTVVFTMEDLLGVDSSTEKLLGIFGAEDTYNDTFEDNLRDQGLVDEDGNLILYGQPPLNPEPPTVADMLQVTLDLDLFQEAEDGFMVVMEEEATDNFGNNNNGTGVVEAALRADAALGVAMDYVDNVNPNTLILTAADSDAGGLEVDDTPVTSFGETPGDQTRIQSDLVSFGDDSDGFAVPLDGQQGNSAPFEPFVTGAPDADGDTFEFGIAWAGLPDVAGSIVSKSYGLNSELLQSTADNTEMYDIMYETLFGLTPEEAAIRRELVGFASLPADTFADGPESGADNGDGEPISANGRTGPFDGQPVQGFSGVQFAPSGDGSTFWFLSDNGFGAKANSADYLLRIYEAEPSFAGDGGDGSIDIQGFVQLSDPDGLIPFDITNGDTEKRMLTGADFDIESFVIDASGDIWVGEEFGPYVLHFNSDGELLEAPIATPNIPTLNTLNGQDPLVIGHRGASGELPEHTLEAYALAIEQGADFVEPDLAITSDGVLIARHEPTLAQVELDENGDILRDNDGNPIVKQNSSLTTNVADLPQFADRLTVKNLDGALVGGWFAEDFTFQELDENVRARQSRDFRDQAFNDQFKIPSLEQVIELVQQVEADTGAQIGIYPETKHPTFFDEQGFSLEEPLIQTLQDTGFTDPNRIFIQSFEVANLIDLQTNLLPDAGLEDLPLVQLYGDTDDQFLNENGGGFSAPYDIAFNFNSEVSGLTFEEALANYQIGDVNLADVVPDFGADVNDDGIPDTTYQDLASAEIFDFIGSNYAEGVGPWKNSFLLREGLDEPVDGDGDGNAEIGSQLTGEVRPYIEWAHDAGMQIHPYTLRDEERFLTLNPDGSPQTPEQEFEQLINLGVDGFFTDFPETGRTVTDAILADEVRSPDNPEVLAGEAEANLRRSRGFEGMAFSPDRQTLYPLLEGAVDGDDDNALRIYEFDVASSSYQGLVGFYQVADPSHAIGDFTPINETEFLVIERDGNQGEDAAFKQIFKVDLSNVDEEGFVEKELLVDLLNIDDPGDLNGDGSTDFDFPFVTIEDVLVIDEDTILVANDNNYPFSVGRGPDIDNNEVILLDLATPLNLDPRLGLSGQDAVNSTPAFGSDGDDVLDAGDDAGFNGLSGLVFAGAGSDLVDSSSQPLTIGDGPRNRVYAGSDADELTAGTNDRLFGGKGNDTLDASAGNGGNRLYGEEGEDELFAGSNDRLFGGADDDILDSSVGDGGNRLYGEEGNDVFFLGEGDRASGDAGDDRFFVTDGGDNTLTGGEGADQFWIASGELPAGANVITDFEAGTDVIGIGGLELSFTDLTVSAVDGGTAIALGGDDLAFLNGVASVGADSFAFV